MTDHLSLTLSALADPTRRGILARLASGEATVKELAEPYDMSLAAVSKHLLPQDRRAGQEPAPCDFSESLRRDLTVRQLGGGRRSSRHCRPIACKSSLNFGGGCVA